MALEKDLDLLSSAVTLERYRELLIRFYGFYRPLESALRFRWGERAPFLQLSQRMKSVWIERDLIALGLSLPELGALPLCDDPPGVTTLPQAMGAMYIMESFTLSGQMLLRHFHRQLGLTPERGCLFFRAYGPRAVSLWQDFQDVLRERIRAPEDHESLIESSDRTFRKLHGWLAPTTPVAATSWNNTARRISLEINHCSGQASRRKQELRDELGPDHPSGG